MRGARAGEGGAMEGEGGAREGEGGAKGEDGWVRVRPQRLKADWGGWRDNKPLFCQLFPKKTAIA